LRLEVFQTEVLIGFCLGESVLTNSDEFEVKGHAIEKKERNALKCYYEYI